uniref:Ig-like domain-containing protein n=1 Tax=Pelusios castaneus TaxID=367368 RepID=A0A8C8SNM5_9SAUR
RAGRGAERFPAGSRGAQTVRTEPGSDGGGAEAGAAPPGPFLVQDKFECLFTNGTEPFRYLQRYIYNRQQIAHYDSELGRFEADTELGRASAEHWNSQPAFLAQKRAEMDTFCRYSVRSPRAAKVLGRTVQPKVKVSPTMSGSQTHPHLLVCSVTGFYPGAIEIKWFRNGQEQMAGVVSTELLQDGDWTYQILVMLEMSPQRGDVYACQVEHISLGEPLTVRWEAQSDSSRSKLLTGVGGFVLGLIFLVPGLVIYLRNKKGEGWGRALRFLWGVWGWGEVWAWLGQTLPSS